METSGRGLRGGRKRETDAHASSSVKPPRYAPFL